MRNLFEDICKQRSRVICVTVQPCRGLGVQNLKVDGADDTNAKNAVDTIKEAIQKVSTQRSALGAVQNRLEHTINNLDNVVENTTSAESQIRDTDMATEMVKYSNNNILAQAGQAKIPDRLFPFCLFFICHLITFSQQIHPYSKPSQQVSAISLRYQDPAHLGSFCEVLPG